MELPRKTYQDIMALNPCFDPAERGYCTSDWEGTALDILRAGQVNAEDRWWVVMRMGWLPAPIRAEAYAKIDAIWAEAKIDAIWAEADAQIASIRAEADAEADAIWAEAKIDAIRAEANAQIVNWLIDALTAYESAATEGESS